MLLLAVPGAPAAQDVLAALEKAGRELKTMQADFQQTKVITLLDEQEAAAGRVLLQVPGRLRWDYTRPQPSVLLIKDGRFSRYFPGSKQLFRGMAKGEADLLVGFGPGAAPLDEKYEVTLIGDEAVGELRTHVLDLRPRAGREGLFASIRLWVDARRYVPVQTRLTEPTGDHTTIRFEHVRLNERLARDAFELKVPADTVEAP